MDRYTVVVFASLTGPAKEGGIGPNAFQSTGPYRGAKGDLYEGGLRVPLIVRWPFYTQAGRVSDLPCALWDLLPTIAEVAGQKPPPDIDGISLLPTLKGQVQTNRHEVLYWESHGENFQQAARMDEWKGLRHGVDGPLELYNLKSDPGERRDVAGAHTEVVEKIEAYLRTARTDDTHWPARTVAENPPARSNSSN